MQDYIADFLIAQYSEINQETRRLRSEGLNRLNFFIAITSAVIGGLVFLSQGSSTSSNSFLLISGALLFLLFIGLDAFRFAISRDINTDFNIRATGRIYRFFADRDPSIEKYQTWQDHDEPTKWVTKNTSGIRRAVQSILSLLSALIVGLTVALFIYDLHLLIVISIAAFITTFFILRGYASRQYRNACEAAHKAVRFPQDKK